MTRTRFPLSVALIMSLGCFPSRPAFVEPRWGSAPPPLALEVTEITQEFRHCTGQCRYHSIVLRRDGHASRAFRTGNRLDSVLVARIDSTSFVELAEALRRNHFFSAWDDGDGLHEPLATESYVISAATLCRRRVTTVAGLQLNRPTSYQAVRSAIDSAAAGLTWKRPEHFR